MAAGFLCCNISLLFAAQASHRKSSATYGCQDLLEFLSFLLWALGKGAEHSFTQLQYRVEWPCSAKCTEWESKVIMAHNFSLGFLTLPSSPLDKTLRIIDSLNGLG